jgi:hypothetical protein
VEKYSIGDKNQIGLAFRKITVKKSLREENKFWPMCFESWAGKLSSEKKLIQRGQKNMENFWHGGETAHAQTKQDRRSL